MSSSKEHKDLEEKASIEQEVKLENIQLGLCVYIVQVVNTTKRVESGSVSEVHVITTERSQNESSWKDTCDGYGYACD